MRVITCGVGTITSTVCYAMCEHAHKPCWFFGISAIMFAVAFVGYIGREID
jgi:hypothetical protein